MPDKNDTVLFVDDEELILTSFKRQFGRLMSVKTASSPAAALEIVKNEGPLSVVVSDMQMPEMNGIDFLKQVKQIAPDTTRIMLTGNANLETAINAVNEGNIFSFVNKPCPPDSMLKVISSALEQYRLRRVEKELLEKTLKGSIKILIDILSLSNPAAFSRGSRIKFIVTQMAKTLQLPTLWEFEIAALLCQLGTITIPADIVQKHYRGEKLTTVEQGMLDNFPQAGCELLKNIPRLEKIAEMIKLMLTDFRDMNITDENKRIVIGAQLLRAAQTLEDDLRRGNKKSVCLANLKNSPAGRYSKAMLEVAERINLPESQKEILDVKTNGLTIDMIIEDDIKTIDGVLLVSKGQEVTPTVITMLKNYLHQGKIENSLRVSVLKACS